MGPLLPLLFRCLVFLSQACFFCPAHRIAALPALCRTQDCQPTSGFCSSSIFIRLSVGALVRNICLWQQSLAVAEIFNLRCCAAVAAAPATAAAACVIRVGDRVLGAILDFIGLAKEQ